MGRSEYWHISKKRMEKKSEGGNYNPTMQSMAPTTIPDIDVDAESMPKRIYPAIAPVFSGI